MSAILRHVLDTLRRIVTSPGEELTRWQRAARWLYDFGRYGWRQLNEDDVSALAAALSFRTLFGLLPVLVVGTVIAKNFIDEATMAEVVNWVVALLGADNIQVSSEEAGVEGVPLGDWLAVMVSQASRMRLTGLGWIGAMVLIYSAISLMVTIENAFNRVCRSVSGRPWMKRVPLYWFVLTVGPILLALIPYLDARYGEAVGSVASWQWLLVLARFAWNLVFIWAFMFALYMWVPNAPLGARSVAIGALVSAVLLEIGKRFLGAYLSNAFSAKALAGSLGLVPLFMFWVYLMWMAVLFGLEVAAMVQYLHGRRMEEELQKTRPTSELVDPAAVLLLMQAVAGRFAQGEPISLTQLTERTGVPGVAVRRIVDRLVQRGFLLWVGHSDECVSLARPADQISAQDLMQVGWELVDASMLTEGQGIVARLREAQAQLAASTTLAALAPVRAQAGAT